MHTCIHSSSSSSTEKIISNIHTEFNSNTNNNTNSNSHMHADCINITYKYNNNYLTSLAFTALSSINTNATK